MTTSHSITEGKNAAVRKAAGSPAQAAPTVPVVRCVQTAVDPATIGYLVVRVLQDPVIRQAWRDAANDCTRANALRTVDSAARAANAVAIAGSETAAAWRRHGGIAPIPRVPDAGPNVTPNPAR